MRRDYYATYFEAEDRHWWFVSRRRILDEAIREASLPSGPVLELGCGPGANLSAFGDRFPMVGVDMSADALRYCRARGLTRLVRASATHLPFRPGVAAGVLAFDLLEHLRDDEGALREFSSVLAPGGRAVMTVPAHRLLFGPHDRISHHLRRYSRSALRERVARSFGAPPLRLTYFFGLLFLLALPWRTLMRLLDADARGRSDIRGRGDGAAARLAMRVMELERRIPLPIGVSLLAVAGKPPVPRDSGSAPVRRAT